MAMLRKDAPLAGELMPLGEQVSRNEDKLILAPEAVFEGLELMVNHSYVDYLSKSPNWGVQECDIGRLEQMKWRKLEKTPVAPDHQKNKAGLTMQLQSVLSAMSTEGTELAFVLVHKDGENSLYFGAYDKAQGEQAITNLEAQFGHFTKGAVLKPLDGLPYPATVQDFRFAGALTGIPALKGENSELFLQTMDNLAKGMKVRRQSQNFAVVIRADALSGWDVAEQEELLQSLEKELTTLAGWEETVTDPSVSRTTPHHDKAYDAAKKTTILSAVGFAASKVIKWGLMLAVPEAAPVIEAADKAASSAGSALSVSQGIMFACKGDGVTETHNPGSRSVTRHYIDPRCKDALELIGRHKNRLKDGKGQGMWNVGVYVLADNTDTVDLVLSTLRGSYAGRETFLDPIRTYNEGIRDGVLCSYAKNMELFPLHGRKESSLSPLYKYFATPLTTPELSIEANLPRQSHAGLEVNKHTVSFNANPPRKAERAICLGEVINEGRPTGKKYWLNVDSLVQHGVLNGDPGSGKSVSTQKVLFSLLTLGIPFLLIDPIKTEYLDWAIAWNRRHQDDPDYEEKRIRLYMPGASVYEYWDEEIGEKVEVKLDQFGINVYQPAVWGQPKRVKMEAHVNRVSSLIAESTGLSNSLPGQLKECIQTQLEEAYGFPVISNELPYELYTCAIPNITELREVLERVMSGKQYAEDIRMNLFQCIANVLDDARKGWKATLLADKVTWNMEEIFDHPAVVCLNSLGSAHDKAFALSILMTWMRDYRESRYNNDYNYYSSVHNKNVLKHLMVIEEAHAVIAKPKPRLGTEEVNPSQKTAEIMESLLRECRGYGQGVLVVDQMVSALISEVTNATKVSLLHMTQSNDEAKLLAGRISLNDEQTAHIHALETGHMIVSDGRHQPCWIKVEKADVK